MPEPGSNLGPPSGGGLKLKIKPIPPSSGDHSNSEDPNVIQPFKICFGPGASSSSSNSRKRQRSDSSTSSMDSMTSGSDPARKMSRVMGTSAEQESTFLTGKVNINYQKKKVIT